MHQSQGAGFLLLELLIAIGIFVIGATAMSGLCCQLIISQKVINGRMARLEQAQQCLETGIMSSGLFLLETSEGMSRSRAFTMIQLKEKNMEASFGCFIFRAR